MREIFEKGRVLHDEGRLERGAREWIDKAEAVETGSDGAFRIGALPPDSYRVVFTRDGYVTTEYGQRVRGSRGIPIVLTKNDGVEDLSVRLLPTGNASGRVHDVTGRPIAGIPVYLLRRVYDDAGQRRFRVAGSVRTDDRGRYRVFWITPGRYYLAAGGSETSSAVTSNTAEEVSGFHYYPGSTNRDNAAPFEVTAGGEIENLDFTLPSFAAYWIRGSIVASGASSAGQAPSRPDVYISARSPIGNEYVRDLRETFDPDSGNFEIGPVPTGTYYVAIQARGSGRAVAVVDVVNRDVEGCVLKLEMSPPIMGRILAVDGVLPETPRLAVLLNPVVELESGRPSRVATRGNGFSINVSSDPQDSAGVVKGNPYRVRLENLPEGWVMTAARLDGVDVLDTPVPFLSGKLEIVVRPVAATVSGVARDAQGRPVPSAEVTLAPAGLQNRPEFVIRALADSNGHFTLSGIVPGDYRLYAWEALEPNAYFDPDLLRHFEKQSAPARVGERTRVTSDVTVIPAEGLQ